MQGTHVSIPPLTRPADRRPTAWTHPGWWALLSALLLCWLAREAAIEGDTIALEMRWMADLLAWRSPAWDQAMMAIKRAHDPLVVAFILGGVGLHAAQRQWQQLRWLVAVVPGGMLANLALKASIQRARPGLDAMIHAHGYSFPSGHAIAAALMAAWLAYAVFQMTRSTAWRSAGVVAGLAMVCGIGFSRVYLGVHYPTDVLAGVLAGAAWFFFCMALRRGLAHARPLPQPRMA